MLNGALTFINGNGYLYIPESSDGYVDYNDENDSPVLSIAIDDETKNVVEVSVAQDADVQRVVVGPAVGTVLGVEVLNAALENISVGETGYLIASCETQEDTIKCVLTQDGRKILTGERINQPGEFPTYRVLNRGTAVSINSLLKLSAADPAGSIADLPKLLVEIADDNNDAVFKIIHAPYDDTITGAAGEYLKNAENNSLQWGDSVTEIYIQ